MDQLKEFLKLAVKYRFWIVIVIAALMPMIGYFATAGPIREQTETKASAVKSALGAVKTYESGIQPNATWVDLTEQRIDVLDTEIRQAWEMLYEQQAPLLTWPPEVAEQYTAWGPTWPEGVSASTITLTNNTYAAVYPDYVEQVYQSFRPFNYEDGTGIVVAPTKQELLRPVRFSPAQPPTLGKVWAAQQKLWIQSTVLDVIDQVNAGAETWDDAPLKQIIRLEVANPEAQDQKSIVEGTALTLAPEITRPDGSTAAAAPAATSTTAPTQYEAAGGGSMGQMAGQGGYPGMGGMGGYPGMMGGGGRSTEPDEVYIFEQAAGQQFREIPVYTVVLVEQNRVLDLIAAFRRSPMSIQVVDFEWQKPSIAVEKPEKGQKNPMFSGMGGYGEMFVGGNSMMRMMGGYPGMGGMPGYGEGMGGYPGMGGMGGYPGMGGMGGYPGMGGMGGAAQAKPQGKDIAQEQFKKLQEREKKAEGKGEEETKPAPATKSSFSDPYYNIVEVHVYGRARFYEPPPAEEPEQPGSLVDAAQAPDAEAAPDAAAPETGADATTEPDAATEAATATEPNPSAAQADEAAATPAPEPTTAPDATGAEAPVDGEAPSGATPESEPATTPEPPGL